MDKMREALKLTGFILVLTIGSIGIIVGGSYGMTQLPIWAGMSICGLIVVGLIFLLCYFVVDSDSVRD